MFVADRCLTSVSLAICYSETGTISLPLEVVFAIKFRPLLIFHREREPDTFIHLYSCIKNPSLPFTFWRAPQVGTRKATGQPLHPHKHKEF